MTTFNSDTSDSTRTADYIELGPVGYLKKTPTRLVEHPVLISYYTE